MANFLVGRVAALAIIAVMVLMLGCSAPQPPDKAGTPDRTITAGIMVKLTLEELVAQADYIVVGRVTEKKSQWNPDRTYIYTLVTLLVEEWVKGEPTKSPFSLVCLLIKGKTNRDSIVIKVPGGQVGDVFQWVEDVPGFEIGEKVLLFLKQEKDGTFSVVGGFQGKLVIEEKIAGTDLSLTELIQRIKAEMAKKPK